MIKCRNFHTFGWGISPLITLGNKLTDLHALNNFLSWIDKVSFKSRRNSPYYPGYPQFVSVLLTPYSLEDFPLELKFIKSTSLTNMGKSERKNIYFIEQHTARPDEAQ